MIPMNISQPFVSPVLEVGHLEAIRAVSTYGRLAEAASSLNVTPSALSHRIREAERRLGVPLYVREHRRLVPTAATNYLVGVASTTLEELARAEADSRRMTGSVRRVVRLAVDTYRSYHWLPGFVRLVRSEHPDIELRVSASGSNDASGKVATEVIDVAIAPGDRLTPGLRDAFLFDDELLFITSPDHPLAGRESIDGPDIEGIEFITYTRTPEPDREFARLFRPTNSYPSWIETVELPEAIVEMVAAGLGTSVLSRWAIADAIEQGRITTSRVGSDGITVPWHAFTRPDDAEACAVADLLASWCQQHNGLTSHS